MEWRGVAVRRGNWPITQKMADVDYVPSTAVDFRHGTPMEFDSIFTEPLRRAAKLGVDTPRLAALEALVSLLDKARLRQQ